MWATKLLSVDGRRSPYLEAGDPASPHVLVLVHAFPVGMRMWEPVAVPHGWRAIAPALPGFDGADPVEAPPPSIDHYAHAVLGVMDGLGIDHAVLGGLSMGGYVAFALWRLARLRWRGLVLADTRAAADSEQGRAGRQKMLDLLHERGSRAIAEEMVPKLLGETARKTQPQLVAHAMRLIERQTSDAIAGALVRLRDRPDSTPLLRDIGVPTLVIVGDEDIVTPPSDSEQLAAQIEDARLVRIPASGHLSCMERPAEFSAALAGFLNAIRG